MSAQEGSVCLGVSLVGVCPEGGVSLVGVCPGGWCLPRRVVSAQEGSVCPGGWCLPRCLPGCCLPRRVVSAW